MARPEGETEGKLKWTPGRIAYLVLILLLVTLVLYLLIARISGKVPSLFGYSVVRTRISPFDSLMPRLRACESPWLVSTK